jgi:transposase-like protein
MPQGSFDPVLVPKGQRRLPGFDEKVIALYARGMTTREIQGHLKEIYKVEVSPSLISAVTDAVLEDVKAWQARPLDAVTNAIEAINAQLRKVTKRRGSSPNPEAVRKVFYFAILKARERWTRPVQDWPTALNHLAIVFPGRVPT